ncbi:MAG: HK97 family phage prohead protease [Rhodoglobus sp.]
MKIKNHPVEIKAGPDDGLAVGEFIVYPSTFTRTADSYGDVVAKGAFLDTIEEWKASGNSMPGLYGHRLDDPDYFVAGALEMSEDDHGWRVKGMFDLDSPKGPQVYRLVKGRRLNQLSFSYDTLDEGQVELADGTKANELRKLKVYEFSFVPIGANSDTSVLAVKSAVESLAADVKAGRVLSTANEQALRDVHQQMMEAVSQMDDVLSSMTDQGKASAAGAAKDEEPSGAKSEEPSQDATADDLETHIRIKILEGVTP